MCAQTLLTASVQSIADMDTYAQFGRAALDAIRVMPDDAPDGRPRSVRIGAMGRTVLEIGVDTDSEELEPEDPQPAEEPQHTDGIQMRDFVVNFMQQEIPMLHFVANFMQQAQFSSNITVWRRTPGLGEKCEMPINSETLVLDVIRHIHTTWPGADSISTSIPWRQRTFCGTIRTSSGWVLVPTQLLAEADVNPGDEVFFKIVRTTLLADGPFLLGGFAE